MAALADDVAEDTLNIMENGYEENGGEPSPFRSASLFSSCTTITLTTNGNGGTIVLDYGDGVCDNLATITINGVEYEITLN